MWKYKIGGTILTSTLVCWCLHRLVFNWIKYMAYKLLQSKAYNQASRIFLADVDGEIWTFGGMAFAEKGEQELRLRKDAIDQRGNTPWTIYSFFDVLGFSGDPVTHHVTDGDDTVVHVDGSFASFQAVYYQYLHSRYPFAKQILSKDKSTLFFIASDQPIAILASKKVTGGEG